MNTSRNTLRRLSLAAALLAHSLALATDPIVPARPRQVAGFHVEAVSANAARDFDVTITNSNWDCNTKVTIGPSGVVRDSVFMGMTVVQGQGQACGNATAPVIKTWLPGVIPTGIYVYKFSGFASCTPRCQGEIIWEGLSNPVEFDLKRFPQVSISPFARAVGAFGATSSGDRIDLALPADGAWGAELLALDGSRVASAALIAESGHATFALPRAPRAGLYLLRIRAPGAVAHTLRVAMAE